MGKYAGLVVQDVMSAVQRLGSEGEGKNVISTGLPGCIGLLSQLVQVVSVEFPYLYNYHDPAFFTTEQNT
jgi:hypothetical protein